ncbi:MAG: hypothetical protein L6R39_003443, partial [Caloplaca ligustica]
NCIVCEKAVVGISSPSAPRTTHEGGNGDGEKEEGQGVAIENHVVIEPKAVIEGSRIGEGTIVEVGAKVGVGAVVGKVLPDHTVIFGYNDRRIDQSQTEDLRAKTVEQHVDVLMNAEMAARKK